MMLVKKKIATFFAGPCEHICPTGRLSGRRVAGSTFEAAYEPNIKLLGKYLGLLVIFNIISFYVRLNAFT